MKLRSAWVTSLATAAVLAASPTWAAVVGFDETGLVSDVGTQVLDFYANGTVTNPDTGNPVGPGPNEGITFDQNGLALATAAGNIGSDDGTAGVMFLFNTADPGSQGYFASLVSIASGFDSFSFDWNSRQNFTVSLLDVNKNTLTSEKFNSGNANYGAWNIGSAINLSSGGPAAYFLSISAQSNTVYLDNLNFSSSGGGNVPEPGSVALVGLALAAMWGVGSRRRGAR